jgi:hypothetical protein
MVSALPDCRQEPQAALRPGVLDHHNARRSDFPSGWSQPLVALQADIFEASHTYRLKGMDKYLTIVEAQADARRYYKAYLADRLEGPWRGLADSHSKPFAAFSNVVQGKEWTANVSHGELLRTGVDETMEVGPDTGHFLGPLAGRDCLDPAQTYFFRVMQQSDGGQASVWSPWHQPVKTEDSSTQPLKEG